MRRVYHTWADYALVHSWQLFGGRRKTNGDNYRCINDFVVMVIMEVTVVVSVDVIQ